MALETAYKKTHPFNVKVYVSMATQTDYTTGGTATDAYTQLGDLKSVQLGGIGWAKSDITHLSSTNAIKESMASWGEQKQVGFKMYFHDGNLDEFLNQNTNTGYGVGRQTASWAFAWPDPTQPTSISATYYQTAWFEDLDLGEASADSDDPLFVDVKIMPSKKGTFITS
jgi:hypothetical protein